MKLSISQVILNVDDNEPSLYAKSRTLRRAGFEVVEAHDGRTALALVAEKSPQLVLLDVHLPDISGLEVCRRIKSEPASQRVPVLHISATHVTEADQQIGLESGADVYLVEPIEPEELITVVRTLLRLRRTEVGLAASEERLRLATESAGFATWDVDLRTGNAIWSPDFYRMLGYGPAGPASLTLWTDRIHPDDRAATLRAFEDARRDRGQFRHEHRIIRNDDGQERWLAPTGMFHLDETRQRTRFIGVMFDATDRRRADADRNELLRRESSARLAAEDAARLKDQFLANLSHELRTPMSAVLGWLHLLRTGKLAPDQHAQALETIERNARLQNQLVNDLLDVSRIVTGQLRIEQASVSPATILAAAIEAVRPQATARRVAITLTLPPEGSPLVRGDASRLQQVFTNLLVNAIKFSPQHAEIAIAMRCTSAMVEIDFVDHGEGIATDMLPLIFERFRQVDGSITRNHGGMGLGLAIARHILDLHGGTVIARSDGPGTGATFTVSLPLDLDLRHADERLLESGATPARDAEGRLGGIHVMAVDDDPSALDMLSSMLKLGGATVSRAADADAAIALFDADPKITVVVSDIGMPGRDGYDLVETLRRNSRAPPARLFAIALTGYARDEDQARALRSGFDAHLAKPFGMDDLFDTILALVGGPENATPTKET
jgi:hypothetical protein